MGYYQLLQFDVILYDCLKNIKPIIKNKMANTISTTTVTDIYHLKLYLYFL